MVEKLYFVSAVPLLSQISDDWINFSAKTVIKENWD